MATTGGPAGAMPVGRMVAIHALDATGAYAHTAVLEFRVGGRFAGTIDLGTSVEGPVTIEVDDPASSIEIRARFLGQAIDAQVLPHQDAISVRFSRVAPHFAAGRMAVATCPDGTSGRPCVTCRDAKSGASWRMCC